MMKNYTDSREETRTENQNIFRTENKIKNLLAAIIIISALALIIFVVKGNDKNVSKKYDQESVVINGVKMKIVAAETQISRLKRDHPELDKCTFDQKMISCLDVAGDKTEYTREYIQEFEY